MIIFALNKGYMTRTFMLAAAFFILTDGIGQQQLFMTRSGKTAFVSDAPLEVISAESEAMEGAVDLQNRTFLFTIQNNTFKGFNSALQQEHFYENYMEVQDYPVSTFEGKIIGEFDAGSKTEQVVRAKGTLNIHGVEQERIIKGTMTILDDKLILEAEFTVPLEDHNIKIPRVVYQKIAEIINVTVVAELIRKPG